MSLSKIVVFDMSGLGSTPRILTVDTAVASALVRAGVAAAHDSAQAGALSLGGALSGVTPTQIVLVHGPQQDRVTRITVPLAAAQAAAAVGAAAGVVGPLAAGVAVAQPNPSISLSSAVTLAEGNSGTTLFSYTLTLVRDGSTAVFPFTWAVAGTGANPANAADFGGALPSGSGSFAVGETTKTITVSVAGDTTVEPDENFLLSATVTGIGTATSLGTITNDDAAVTPPTVSLSSALVQAEGNSGTTLFRYTLTLARNGSTAAFPYSYSVAGTGANPADAADFGGTFPSGSGTFAAGETTKTIAILATGDTAVEPDEAFLLSATVTGVGSVTANGTISNDDVVVTAAAARRAKLQLGASGVEWIRPSRVFTNLIISAWNIFLGATAEGGRAAYTALPYNLIDPTYWNAATGGFKKMPANRIFQTNLSFPWPYGSGGSRPIRVFSTRTGVDFAMVSGPFSGQGAIKNWQGGSYRDCTMTWPAGGPAGAVGGQPLALQIYNLPDSTADGLGETKFYVAEIDAIDGNWLVDPRTVTIDQTTIDRANQFGVWRPMDLQVTNAINSLALPMTAANRARYGASVGTDFGSLTINASAVLTLGSESVTFTVPPYDTLASITAIPSAAFAEPLFNPAKTPGAPFLTIGARANEAGIRIDAPSGASTTFSWEGSTKTIVMKPKSGCTWSQLVAAWTAFKNSADPAVNNCASCLLDYYNPITITAGLTNTVVTAQARFAFTGGRTAERLGQISEEQIAEVATRASNLKTIWFQIPAAADETWIRTTVGYLRDHMPATCGIEFEYANEVWNDGFGVKSNVIAYGLANNDKGYKVDGTGAAADPIGINSFYWAWGKLAATAVSIAKDEWKKTGRTDCRGVFAAQCAPETPMRVETMRTDAGYGALFDATFEDIAVAPYWTTSLHAMNSYTHAVAEWTAGFAYTANPDQAPYADSQTKIITYNGSPYIVLDAHTSTAGNPPGSAGGAAHYTLLTPTTYEPYGKTAIEAQATIVSPIKSYATSKNKRLIAYEQGPGDQWAKGNTVMATFTTALSHDDVMFRLQQYALYEHFLIFGDDTIYAQFGDTLPWTPDNPWQWQDYDGAPDAISPKRRALQDFVAYGVYNPYASTNTISPVARTDKANLTPMATGSALAFAAPSSAQSRPIVMDAQTTYQTFNGVGAALTEAACYNLLTNLTATQRHAVLLKAFGGDGLNLVRVGFSATDFGPRKNPDGTFYFWTYDDTDTDGSLTNFSTAKDDDYVIPIVKEILAINPNVRIVAACWSPMAFMKSGNDLKGGSFVGNAANYTTHANYLVKAMQAWAAKGCPVFAISPQNEPNVTGGYPTCSWTGAQMRDFIKTYLAPAMSAAGLTQEIWAGDGDYSTTASFLNTIAADATARAAIKGMAWHGYGGTPDAMTTLLSSYPTIPQHFTEYRTLLTDSASLGAAQIESTTGISAFRAGASDVMLWNLALDETGQPAYKTNRRALITIPSDKSGNVSYNLDYYALAHLSRYVQRGAKRIYCSNLNVDGSNVDLTTNGSTQNPLGADIMSVAFLNPDNSQILVLFNCSDTSSKNAVVVDAVTGQTATIAVGSREMVTAVFPSGTVAARSSGPSTFTATSAAGGLQLAWSGVDASRPIVLFKGQVQSGEPPFIVLPAGTTSYLDTAVTSGQTYYYAHNAVGSGSRANTVRTSGTYTASSTPTAALARDSVATATSTDPATSCTVSHTVASDANLLVVALTLSVSITATGSGVDSVPSVSSVKAGGVSMTKIDSAYSTGNPTNKDRAVEVWALVNPPTGAVSVVATINKPSGIASPSCGLTSISYKNAFGTPTQTDGSAIVSTSGGNTSLSAVSTSDNARCEVLMVGSIRSTTAPTPGAGQTTLSQLLAGSNTEGIVTAQPGGANVTSSMSWATADQGALLAVPIRSI